MKNNGTDQDFAPDKSIGEGETITVVNDGISLIQKSGGFSFGTDALLLAAFIRGDRRLSAMEIGAGSGIVSLLCAGREKLGHITAVEVLPEIAGICRRNIGLNGMEARISAVCADVRTLAPASYDAVYCNPPYMRADSGYRNRDSDVFASRHELHGGIGELCAAAGRQLRYGGIFYTVYRPDRIADMFCALRGAALEPKRMITVYRDYGYAPSLILIEAKKGGAPSLFATPPFFIYENGTESEHMKFIYENGDFDDRYRKKRA